MGRYGIIITEREGDRDSVLAFYRPKASHGITLLQTKERSSLLKKIKKRY
jgi:hypothetical protein